MSLLEDEESGDEIHRVSTSTNILSQASSDGQDRVVASSKMDGKKEKEKKSKQLDEHRKGSSLTLPWKKDKDKDKDKDKEEKQAKRTKQAKSKSPPPNSPKTGRAADKKALKAPLPSQPAPSPNTKASRKPYAQLSAEEDDFEELVMNVHSVDVEQAPIVMGLDLGEELRRPHHHRAPEGRLEPEPAKKTGGGGGGGGGGTRSNAVEAGSPVLSLVVNPLPSPVVTSTHVTSQLGALTPVTTTLSADPAMDGDIDTTTGPVNANAVNSGDGLIPSQITPVLNSPSTVVVSEASFGVDGGAVVDGGAGVEVHTNPAPDSEWLVSEELREKCHKQFASLDTKGGLLSGEKAHDFFIQSKLPKSELAQIWQLADHNCDNALSEEEFLIAMKLVLVRRKGYDIPAILPTELTPQGPHLDFLLIEGTLPAHQPVVPIPDLLPPVVPLGDLTYTAPIGATLDDIFAPHPALGDGDFTAAGPDQPGLALHIPPLGGQVVLDENMDAAIFSPVAVPEGQTLLALVNDELLHGHSEPAVGNLLSFEDNSGEGDEQEIRREPAVGKLVSIDTDTSAAELGQEWGDEWEEEEEVEEKAHSDPLDESGLISVSAKSDAEKATHLQRTRHSSVRDEDHPLSQSSSSPVKKSKSLRTPVRPAPPVPSHLREKPLSGTQYNPSSAMDREPLDAAPSDENRRDDIHEREIADSLGTIIQRKRASAMHYDPSRSHGRSASLDLNKIFMKEEGHEDLPSATPPKPPPKPTKTEHSVEEVSGGYLLIKSASTGSISNAVLAAATLGEELLTNRRPEATPTAVTENTAGATTRQPTKMPMLPPAKTIPSRKEDLDKESPGARVQVTTPLKEEVKKESAVRNKQELQISIQQYKETNAMLTAVNNELESALFKLIADRIDLQHKLELLQNQQ